VKTEREWNGLTAKHIVSVTRMGKGAGLGGGRGGAVCSAVNEAVPGLGSAPPWDFRLRPRGGLAQDGKTMVPFRHAPWKDPQKRDSSGRLAAREKPEFFTRYLRLNKPDRGPAASLTGAGAATSNYEQCEANPGVARDKITNKYRLLMIADGQAKPFGRFHVEKEGVEGYSAYTDMQTKGPLGIMGVPGSIGNIAPPGVALLSKRAWHVNRRNRPNIDEGNYDEYAEKENILAAQRFSQQRLGNDFARLERDLADDVANARGVHKQVAALRQSFAGFGSPSDPMKDSMHLDTQV
jgi:hypothetical protein